MTILYNDFSYKIITGLVIFSKRIAGDFINAFEALFSAYESFNQRQMNMKEHNIIEYLNCKKDFQKDSVQFKGPHSYEDAVKWGRNNLDNFHLDMIKVVPLDQNSNAINELYK